MWGSLSKGRDCELQLMVLHGAAPHSRALLKPRRGWTQWLGQHGDRSSGRTALLSASDHRGQPLPASPPLLWGLLTLTEAALGAQRESFSTGRDKLPYISVQGHCHQHIFSCSPSCLRLLGLICRAAVGDFPSPGRILSPVQKRQQ